MNERVGMVVAGVALHLLLYGASIPFLFSWDDRKIVLESPEVRGEGPLLATLSLPYNPWGYKDPTFGVNYRPLTLLSLGAQTRLWGLNPGPLHVGNILLGGIGAGAFGILLSSLGAPAFVAWTSVILLSCHPVRSEPILSIVGRGESLAFLFLVGALLARRRPVVSGLLFFAAISSKENAFVAPALLLLVLVADAIREEEAIPWRARVLSLVPLGLVWGSALLLAFAARFLVLGGFFFGSSARISAGDNLFAALSPIDRFMGALSLFPLAVRRVLWPTVLSPDYSKTTFLADQLLEPGAVAAGAVLLVAVLALAALLLFVRSLRDRAPLAWLGLAWALVSYFPFANFLFPNGISFTERILYAPAAGVVLAAACALGAFRERSAGRPALRLLPPLVVVLLALIGSAKILWILPDWRDDRTLMEAVARDVPTNSKAFWNLAILSLGEGKSAEASRHLARALALDPNYRAQVGELIRHAEAIGRPDEAAALAAVLRSAPVRPVRSAREP